MRWLHVYDRAADDYEIFCRARLNQCGWVIRGCRLNRIILTPEGQETTLEEHLADQPVSCTETLEVPATAKCKVRTALLYLRFAAMSVPRPRITNAWIRKNVIMKPRSDWNALRGY